MTKGQVLAVSLMGMGRLLAASTCEGLANFSLPGHDHHDRSLGTGWPVYGSGTARPLKSARIPAGSLGRSANRDSEDPIRGLDASLGMEREVWPAPDTAVLAGRSLRQNGGCAQSWTSRGLHRHGSHGGFAGVLDARLGPGASGEGHLITAIRDSRNGADGPGHCGRVLWAKVPKPSYFMAVRTADGRR